MVNYDLLKVFYIVANEKNITKASEKLYISQPAVSNNIKELEIQLQQKLFNRKNKGVELTAFGKILYETIHKFYDSMEKIEILSKKYNDMDIGAIKFGSSSSNVNQILIKVLSIFAKKFPNINIEMKRNSNEKLKQELNDGLLDVIFIDNDINNLKNFQLVKQFNISYKLIGNSKYKNLYPQQNIDAQNFPINDIILPNKYNSSRKFIDDYFKFNNINLNPKYELDNYILVYEFVKNGFGMAFANKSYYQEQIKNKEVEIIFENFDIPARKIDCITLNNHNNKILYEFIKIVKTQ